jgi:hypothetical protein
MRTLKLVVTATRRTWLDLQTRQSFSWAQTCSAARISLHTCCDSIGVEYLREEGYCFFAEAEAAADAIEERFLYSALACRSIGISGSASFHVVKKLS